jgi:WhiB family redox-sensing transcriptional regulator
MRAKLSSDTGKHWTDDAACLGLEQFFHSYKDDDKKIAKDICAECPVRLECLQDALDMHERFGVRGSVDERELRIAQGINHKGETAVDPKRRIRCLYCGPRTSDQLEVVERKRTKTEVRCTVCGLQWVTRKLINKRNNF